MARQDAVGLFTDGGALAAPVGVPVIVVDALPRAAIDDGMMTVVACSLFALKGEHGEVSDLDALEQV